MPPHAPPEIPFICGDGTSLPFRPGSFKAAILSFALHEQEPEVRRRILGAARRVLVPGGRLILVDFENPWDSTSRLAYAYTSVIERIAGRDHLRRNRDFHRRGGLRALLAENGFSEVRPGRYRGRHVRRCRRGPGAMSRPRFFQLHKRP